eukprot:98493-Rhodomonas_salina.1
MHAGSKGQDTAAPCCVKVECRHCKATGGCGLRHPSPGQVGEWPRIRSNPRNSTHKTLWQLNCCAHQLKLACRVKRRCTWLRTTRAAQGGRAR